MKSMNKIIALVALSFATFVNAQETFSLFDAKVYALENHANIKNAILEEDIAHQKVVETRGIGLPQISINGRFTHFINLPTQVFDASVFNPNAPKGTTVAFKAGTEYNVNGNLQVQQLLFSGSYIVGLQASKFYKSFAATQREQTEEEILFNVIQAYQLVAISKENIAFVDSILLATEELIEKQKNYLELGMMKQEDFDQLSFTLLTAKNAKSTAELQLDNMKSLLKLSIGYPIDSPIEISESTEQLLANSLQANNDIHNNIQYQLIKKKIHLSELNAKNRKFENLPVLSAFFQQDYNAFRNEFDFFKDRPWYPQTIWGLNLQIPVFSGLSRWSREKQAKIEVLKDQNSLTLLENSLKFQEKQAKNKLTTAQNNRELQEKQVKLARKIYGYAITKQEIGRVNSIEVTQKYNQLLQAQAQYLGTISEIFNARLELDKIYNNINTTK